MIESSDNSKVQIIENNYKTSGRISVIHEDVQLSRKNSNPMVTSILTSKKSNNRTDNDTPVPQK